MTAQTDSPGTHSGGGDHAPVLAGAGVLLPASHGSLGQTPAGQLFDVASRRVLRYLHEHVPLAFWGITRVENGRQTYLAVEGDGYALTEGNSHEWAASFCIHMTSGAAPHVAPDAQQVPLYRAAGVNDGLQIGAYAAAPITDADGTLFGAICGLDPAVKDAELHSYGPVLLLLSDLLTAALVADRGALDLQRTAVEAQLRADVDALTGVYSRSAWERLLDAEEDAYAQLSDPTSVVIVDLNGLKQTNDLFGHDAGDRLLVRAAVALASAVRSHDPVARLGGDEFGLLLRHCSNVAALARARTVRQALAEADVAAAVGVSTARPGHGLRAAQREADRAMYEHKRADPRRRTERDVELPP